MSTTRRVPRLLVPAPAPRTGALVGTAALTAGYCSTLYWVTTVRGGTGWLVLGVLTAAVAARLLAPLRERAVLGVVAATGVLAGALYLWAAPVALEPGVVLALLAEPLVLGSGNSVLTIASVDVWIATLTPLPVFCSVSLALRRRYVAATLAGGWLLVLLALTGDATVTETLLGTLGAVGTVGFGGLDRRDATVDNGDLVVVLLACMAVLAVTVPLVPSGSADPIDPADGVQDGWVGGHADAGAGAGTDGEDGDGAADEDGANGDGLGEPAPLDDQVLDGGQAAPGGPIELSTDVRFVVESEVPRRWRVDALDFYTGTGWERQGRSPWALSLPAPPGPSETVNQSVDLRASSDGLPAAAYPVSVDGIPSAYLTSTSTGTPAPRSTLSSDRTYSVRSEVPASTSDVLRSAGTDYPAAIEERYTQLPESTPDRVGNRTDQVTADADTPYETAVAIQAYLQDSHSYSQDVSAPEGDVVDAFLFEMDAGYCTYFASSMAAMLRTQGVPARVAVGYDSGQYAGNDTWVVRGTDAHSWVEVYFPDVGWVEFDPTPAADRDRTRRDAIETARENGTANVDVDESVDRDVRFEEPESDGQDGSAAGDRGDGAGTADGGGPANETDAEVNEERIPPTYRSDAVQTNGTEPYVDPTEPSGEETDDETEANATTEVDRPTVPGGHRLLDGFHGPILALVLVAGSVAGVRRTDAIDRARPSRWLVWQRRRSPERDVERATERLDALLARRHRPRQPGETQREYVTALGPAVDDRAHRAVELRERVRYAGAEPAAVADELVAVVDELVREHHPVASRLPD